MKRGFTLIELLAVIVILAIVLVIAVPQILKVIDQSRRDSLAASVRMYASALETNYLVSQTSNTPLVAPIKEEACPLVVDFNDGTCTYDLTVINDAPVATVTIVGSSKFAGYIGIGTKSGNVTVMNSNEYDTEAPTVNLDVAGSGTYVKGMGIKITVSDDISLDTNSLRYEWTTSTTEPAEESFSTTFINGSTIDTPSNANGGYYLWILAKDTTGNRTIIRSGIFSLDNILPTITMLGSSTVTINAGDTYTDAGATANDDIDKDITSKIIKTGTVDTGIAGTYTVTYTVSDTAGNSATPLTRTVNVIAVNISGPNYITSKGVNGPVLATGMVPIKWNGSTWVDTTIYDPNWYNYNTANKQWANARTADGSMWVWIPRYIYKISSGWHSSTTGAISIQFTQGTNDNWNSSVIGNISADTTANASNNTWTNHPAFTFGSTELTGIWVAKFEAASVEKMNSTYDGCNTGSENVSTKTIKILPNVLAWVCINNSNAFLTSRNMETKSTYGWGTSGNGIDTHLMKNVEWGAVAYLSKSIYGKDTTEVFINNAKSLTTGCGASTVSGSQATTCSYTYETANGVKASTTGTIYGVYDMKGGVEEQTAAYLNNNNAVLTTYSSSLLSADAKYKDVYTVAGTDNGSNNYAIAIDHKGDAIYETSGTGGTNNGAWFYDYSTFPYIDHPSFYRGGNSSETGTAGMFDFKAANANQTTGANGFRPVLVIGAGL